MQFATIYNLRKTSQFFFYVFALAYLLSFLLSSSGFAIKITRLLSTYLFLPTVFTAILLFTSSILQKIDLEEHGHHHAIYAVWILAFGVLLAFILLNLLGVK